MKKKKKNYNRHKTEWSLIREEEIREHGKLISLRPGKVHKSKKKYNRKENWKNDENADQ